MKILCLIKHRWEKQPDEFVCYGMGLESFEVQKCSRCEATRIRMKWFRADGRTRFPWVKQ